MVIPDDDFDARVRYWVEPDSDTVQRVKATALSATAHRPSTRLRFFAWTLVTSAIVVAGFWAFGGGLAGDQVLTARLDGDLLIVRAPNGPWCVLGPPVTDNGIGEDLIAFQGER